MYCVPEKLQAPVVADCNGAGGVTSSLLTLVVTLSVTLCARATLV
jgi:hypothetical protein